MSGRVENNMKIQVVSEFQTCGLGVLPPRMPDRADPQVPDDAALGDVRYGRIGHVYFYDENSDASVGMIEVFSALTIKPAVLRLSVWATASSPVRPLGRMPP